MNLYGLKDKDGKEYEVILPDITMPGAVDNRTFKIGDLITIKPIEPEPMFKIGEWLAFDDYRKIFCYVDNVNGYLKGDDTGFYSPEYCKRATPQEVEQHLRKICDEKGYKDGVKIREIGTNNTHTLERHREWYYLKESDSFHGCTPSEEWDFGSSNPYIYHNGQFAEIVTEKKKLPKTKREFRDFLVDWQNGEPRSIVEFLKEYEDI